MKIKRARAALLTRLTRADDAIGIAAQRKREVDLHVGLTLMHQFVVTLRAGAAPHRPRDRVKDRRFARAVIARQAADVNAAEVDLGVTVRHEVGEV